MESIGPHTCFEYLEIRIAGRSEEAEDPSWLLHWSAPSAKRPTVSSGGAMLSGIMNAMLAVKSVG